MMTRIVAPEYPKLLLNCCTPGFYHKFAFFTTSAHLASPVKCPHTLLSQVSVCTVDGWPDGAYFMSKVGNSMMTRIVAPEYPKLLLNCCTPGFVKTGAVQM